MSIWLKATGYFVLALSVLLIASLLSTSYSATLYLLIGVLVAWPIIFVVSTIPKSGKWLAIGGSVTLFFIIFTSHSLLKNYHKTALISIPSSRQSVLTFLT